MQRTYAIDESALPLLHVQYFEPQDDSEFSQLLATFDRLLYTCVERYALVVESHHSRMVPLHQIQSQATWIKRRDALLRKHVAGVGLVLGSAVQRAVFKVLLSLVPLSVPHKLCPTRAEAERWAYAQLGLGQDGS